MIDIKLYLFRAAKYDSLELFLKGLQLQKSKTAFEYLKEYILDIVGPKVLLHLINNKMINIDNVKELYNPNPECVRIIKRINNLDDKDLLHLKLARKEIDGLVDLVTRMPKIFSSSTITNMKQVLEILSIDELSTILKQQGNDDLYDFVCNIKCTNHVCNYNPKYRMSFYRKMLLWAKTRRICCIISQIQSGDNSEIFIQAMLPFLTEEDINIIMSQCDTSGFNAFYALLHYPNLLYQHKNWVNYTLELENIHDMIIYKDKLENYRKLLCISKEIGFLGIPIFDYSTEITRLRGNL